MQLIFREQPRFFSKGKCVVRNDWRLYSDDYCLIEVTPGEHKQTYFHQTEEKFCFILGKISIPKEKMVASKNPAAFYLENYINQQEAFLLICDGNFLLIEYDIKTHSLIICRDLLGLKHAYYTKTSNAFSLSTSIVHIIQFRKKEMTHIDANALNLYLTFQYLPQPYTLFTNVFQLPLHKTLLYKDNALTLKDHGFSYINMLCRHIGNNTNDLREILVGSFKRQLNDAGAKIGAFLSGGMDTSSNVAILASDLGIHPVVFTASFKEQKYDETPYAKIMAKKYHLKHVILTITPDVLQELPKISEIFDSPIADRAIIPEYLICQKAREMGITHMVTGEGGDEVLSYPRNLPDNIKFAKKLFTNDKALADYYYSVSALVQENLRKHLLNRTDKNTNNYYLYTLYQSLNKLHPFEKIYYGQWQTWLIDDVLMKDTQLFKYASLQFVSPYVDIDLMKHCIRLKAEQKMKLLHNKKYLKNKLKTILPEIIINKPKHKFLVPVAKWLQDNLHEQTHDMLLAKNSIVDSFMDKKRIRRMIEDHKQGKADYNRQLWGLLFLENWYKIKKQYL